MLKEKRVYLGHEARQESRRTHELEQRLRGRAEDTNAMVELIPIINALHDHARINPLLYTPDEGDDGRLRQVAARFFHHPKMETDEGKYAILYTAAMAGLIGEELVTMQMQDDQMTYRRTIQEHNALQLGLRSPNGHTPPGKLDVYATLYRYNQRQLQSQATFAVLGQGLQDAFAMMAPMTREIQSGNETKSGSQALRFCLEIEDKVEAYLEDPANDEWLHSLYRSSV